MIGQIFNNVVGGVKLSLRTPLWNILYPSTESFARASSASYRDSSDDIQTVTADNPRFDYEGGTQALLIEPASTNVLRQSEDMTIDAADWFDFTSGRVGTTEKVADPARNGANYYALDVLTSANNYYAITSHTHTKDAAAETWTASVDVKAGTEDLVCLQVGNSAASKRVRAWFNVSTGVILSNVAVTWTYNTASIVANTDGSYRCSLTVDTDTDTVVRLQIYAARTDGAIFVANPTVSDEMIYVQGAQLEEQNFPTSYIATTGTSATRAAETLTYTGVPATNESRALVDGVDVDVDNWAGNIADFLTNGMGRVETVAVYETGKRPPPVFF